ncbi:hypothetical protein D7Z94_05925 [Ulvibacterium marinum]|uniref:DUF6371 domain-containing protein n=2 Tax=Ulvibacterium marinum TaxID=2419782 RepID=A0A3B0CE89_9FLAO|nr:hypothetical protein D7Z94_05925 [Ulvibacterium marinum]
MFDKDEVEASKKRHNLTGINRPWPLSTAFYQVDLDGNIRGGKILNYEPETRKRVEKMKAVKPKPKAILVRPKVKTK